MPEEHPEPKSTEYTTKPNSLSSSTVLLAEDDAVSRKIMQRYLEDWGYRIISVANGNDAWGYLRDEINSPSLILLDWMMPGLDGIELCHRIRQQNREIAAYILLVTARRNPEDLVAGFAAGADDYISKPFDPQEVRARLAVGKRIVSLEVTLAARIGQLQEALTNIRTLHGLLPICSHCKKIRDDGGYWRQIEAYIHNHSDAQFSHSLCPDCLREYYPDFADDIEKSIRAENSED